MDLGYILLAFVVGAAGVYLHYMYREYRRSSFDKYYNEGVMCMDDRRYGMALRMFEKALKFDPKSRNALELRNNSLFEDAKQQFSWGNYLLALELFNLLRGYDRSYPGVDNYVKLILDRVMADNVMDIKAVGFRRTLKLLRRLGYGVNGVSCRKCGKKIPAKEFCFRGDELLCPHCGTRFKVAEIRADDLFKFSQSDASDKKA